MRRWLCVLICLFAGLASLPAHAKDFAVVVPKTSPTKTLAWADLVKICKGTMSKWPDGKEIKVIMRDPSAPEMRIAVQKVYGVTPEDVKKLIDAANSAQKDHFIIVPTDAAIVKTVQVVPGSVGIVDVYSITGGVNVLKVDGKVPLEPGYALHGTQ
jgi:ABC-type phosphate transport system substrate-binding protein